MRVSVVQMNAGQDKTANIAQARALVGQAMEAERPELIVLPEMWTCLGGDRATKFAASELLPQPGAGATGGDAYEALRSLAVTHRLYVHGGSIAEREHETLYNTSLVFDPHGREIARYRKIHLFDITTPDGAGYRESAIFGRGAQLVTFTAGPVRVGCAICYDLRFPELFLRLRQAGAELILLPAAFTLQTGKDHWEVLLRARAIETQCWLAAAATWGPHREASGDVRQTYGHSLICDPWGHVVAKVSDGPGFASARLDPELTAKVRRDMPLLDHRVLV
jgi:nitrilase